MIPVVTCSYKIDKDGKVATKEVNVKKKCNFPTKPERGTMVAFKIKIDDKKATVSDFGVPEGEEAKAVVESQYKKKVDSALAC